MLHSILISSEESRREFINCNCVECVHVKNFSSLDSVKNFSILDSKNFSSLDSVKNFSRRGRKNVLSNPSFVFGDKDGKVEVRMEDATNQAQNNQPGPPQVVSAGLFQYLLSAVSQHLKNHLVLYKLLNIFYTISWNVSESHLKRYVFIVENLQKILSGMLCYTLLYCLIRYQIQISAISERNFC